MPEESKHVTESPAFFENWRRALGKKEFVRGFEFPLYSDSQFVGEANIGPYKFINTIAHASHQREMALAPVIVVRVDMHMEFGVPEMKKTDTSLYHGGSLSDEIAALAALAVGGRMKCGPVTREFEPGNPAGTPVAYFGYEAPPLLLDGNVRRLPRAVGTRSILDLTWLEGSVDVDPLDQIVFVRAARSYQEAVWVAESDPALAWLLLVSAIETAAARWDQAKLSAIDRLRDSKPSLVETVEAQCPQLLSVIATTFADTLGITRKFIAFALNFLPPPPPMRPPAAFQIEWNAEFFERSLRTIYNHRSKALHTGVPFPAPMCDPPMTNHKEWAAPAERSVASAASAAGGVWMRKDMPFLLHTFEYITREVLKRWWSSIRAH